MLQEIATGLIIIVAIAYIVIRIRRRKSAGSCDDASCQGCPLSQKCDKPEKKQPPHDL